MVTRSRGHGQPPGGTGSAVGCRAVAQVRTAAVWWPMDSLPAGQQKALRSGRSCTSRPPARATLVPEPPPRSVASWKPASPHAWCGLAQGSGSSPQGLCQPRPDVKCDTKGRTRRRCPSGPSTPYFYLDDHPNWELCVGGSCSASLGQNRVGVLSLAPVYNDTCAF